jgi:glycosyltransferase involved in cell wall biosynthesis
VPDHRYRVLFIATHAVQYASPVFRQMALHPRLETQVAFCSLQGAEGGGVDPEFGKEVKWDVPLLDGFPWTQIPNRAPHPGLGRFFGLINTGLWRLIRKGRFDAVVIFTGYRYASFWIALAAAKFTGTPAIFGTDAASIHPRGGSRWKMWIKPFMLSRIFRRADASFGASPAGKALIHSLGVPENKIAVLPIVVDNNWWLARAPEVDRAAVRASWGIPQASFVILFCAKLQQWKRPQDLLRAFAQAAAPSAHLIFAGDGPLSSTLEAQSAELGVRDRVHFLGFLNQSQLPAVYCASDLLVLPSDYEPFGVVVNEAMLCGCAVAVSDRVGAGPVLVRPETGFVFPCGDVDAIAQILRRAIADPARLSAMAAAGRVRMDEFSPRTSVREFVKLLDTALPPR